MCRGPSKVMSLRYIRRRIFRKPLQIEAWFQRRTNRKWHMGYKRHVIPNGLTRGPNAIRAQYLENSWRCYLATIANYYLVCCDAVRSTILETAWLLVHAVLLSIIHSVVYLQLHHKLQWMCWMSWQVSGPVSRSMWADCGYSYTRRREYTAKRSVVNSGH